MEKFVLVVTPSSFLSSGSFLSSIFCFSSGWSIWWSSSSIDDSEEEDDDDGVVGLVVAVMVVLFRPILHDANRLRAGVVVLVLFFLWFLFWLMVVPVPAVSASGTISSFVMLIAVTPSPSCCPSLFFVSIILAGS